VREISTSYSSPCRKGTKMPAHFSGSWPSHPPQTKSADFTLRPSTGLLENRNAEGFEGEFPTVLGSG
jgi:hypothetical protein